MVKIVFFVPESHCEAVKSAVFAAGGGRIGDYASCSWQTKGIGQFLPLASSDPFLGEQGRLERVAEYRVELVCEDANALAAVDALIAAHPYEEPAYDIYRVWTRDQLAVVVSGADPES